MPANRCSNSIFCTVTFENCLRLNFPLIKVFTDASAEEVAESVNCSETRRPLSERYRQPQALNDA